MTRATATALALVNWKGVFYERYLLDRHVTALEGANGAGKTTVMVGAYVVLMPDMTRLRFSNVGESSGAGGDKGIYGRLGEPGRPSYAALEIEVEHGKRIVAGTCLIRRSEPQVELVPFTITGIDLGGSLKDVLLLTENGEDAVPALADVRRAVQAKGGTFTSYPSVKDYFAALFEHGITPLRLASDEDRNKLNEMLRTSMTGGISRALTGELRSFLLREEPGLSETLTHMRANLDACHRTRTEVAEARVLERELSAVYEAAKATLDATLQAVRSADEEAHTSASAAREAAGEARRRCEELSEETRALEARLAELGAALEAAKARADHARDTRERTTRAHEATTRLRAATLEATTVGFASVSAETTRLTAVAARDEAREAREKAREAYDRAARGLADLQSGLEDLHVSAQASRRLQRSLAEAETALGKSVTIEAAPAELERVQAHVAELDARRVRIARDVSTREVRREERARALAALAELSDGPVDTSVESPHATATRLLAKFAEADARAGLVVELEERVERERELTLRQEHALTRARDAGFAALPMIDGASARLEAEVRELSAEVSALDARGSARTLDVVNLEHTIRATEERIRGLTVVHERFARAKALASECAAMVGYPIRNQEDGERAGKTLDDARASARESIGEVKRTRERLLHEAETYERDGGPTDPEIMRLRDELDGELLSLRFDDLEIEEAGRKEAALGSLVDALVVDTPEQALRTLLGKPRRIATVHLVRPDAEVGAQTIVGESGGDVVVVEPYGLRITRIEPEPRLGARARKRRAEGLRAEYERLEGTLRELEDRAAKLDRARRSLDTLFVDLAVLEAGPLDDGLEVAKATLEKALADLEVARRERDEAKSAFAKKHPVLEKLRELTSEAFLLEPPHRGETLTTLENQLAEAKRGRKSREGKDAARKTVAELLYVLAEPVTEGAVDDALGEQLAPLEAERDRLYGAARALSDAVAAKAHVSHEDAERILAERANVVPALEETLARTRDEANAAEARVREAETQWEAASREAQNARAKLDAANAEAARASADLEREGTGEIDETHVAAVSAEDEAAKSALAALEEEHRAATLDHAVKRERRVSEERAYSAREREAEEHEARSIPARALAISMRELAEAGALVWPQASPSADPKTLFAHARGMAEVLADRLGRSRAGGEIANRVRERIALTGEDFARAVVPTWLEVVDWLKRRLPVAIATLADPTAALLRLRDDLASLEGRLGHQEKDLRGASEDVARGIDVQLRRARAQVRRLNQGLAGVHFGSIGGIRIEMKRVERMDQVLSALREGKSQDLLFDSRMPVEEALSEIFRRHAGGKAGTARILDYREYLELSVDVQRAGKSEWEAASPARLSTGEGIGVGAAILMVVLTEWERDSNLLRSKRPVGSLRFLFLDEANRLSQDNLTVLFDLCQSLELQLLVAAPEVARAEGATTYRLVRRTDEQGREEVVVSGRRALRDAQGATIERPAERAPASITSNEPSAADTPPEVSLDPSTGQALLLGGTGARAPDSED